jgi:large repetitive protein
MPVSLMRALRAAFVSVLLLLGVSVASAQAAGTPDLQLTGGPASSVLYGNQVPVDLTASLPASAPKGYNLAYRVVLPAGTSYVSGSAGGQAGEPTILANKPATGQTTLIWPNVYDLVPNASYTLSFKVAYNDTSASGTPKYDVGDTLPIQSGAYISLDPRDEADFDANGVPSPTGSSTYTGWAEQSTTTSLTAIKVTKKEPHPEGEIPRGVHDHQTVYTLQVKNNEVNPTKAVSLEDWLPAGLEFLGCANTPDHTTNAPTYPGHTEEYAGSGPIVVTHPTAAEGCLQPDLVETVNVDPDGSGPLPAGVYTHVKWNNIGDFAKSDVKEITYAAAIPIRENTMDWNGAAAGNGTAPATTGAQTSNLDNNSGPETYDEQPLLNGAIATGAYQSPVSGPKTVSDEGTLLRTAEDIAIQKSNDNATLTQGDLTKWTLDVQVSEYRSVTDLEITDTLPNGLCPLGAQNYTTGNSASDSECAADPAHGPSAPYSSVAEQADGTYVIKWDKSTVANLGTITPSGTRQITFWTKTRTHYQSNFEDAAPVRSKDSVENKVSTQGFDWIRVGSDSKKIDHDEEDGTLDYDVSGSGKSATGPNILKEVAATYPGSDCRLATYGKTVPLYGPGDEVCWKLQLTFPANLNTESEDVYDVLPAGLSYIPGSWQVTAANNVAVGAFDITSAGYLHWKIGNGGADVQPGQTFEIVFRSTVGSPAGHASGDVEGNLMKFSYENTAGTAFTLRDRTDFKLKLPVLALDKGVKKVGDASYVDDRAVQDGNTVEYRLAVKNSGDADASSSRVWDLLPAGISCSDVVLGSISNGGTCSSVAPGQSRISWSGIAVAKGATANLTYRVVVPNGVAPSITYTNTAGVVEFTYTTNVGTEYQLVPANTTVKDPTLPSPNAPAAEDTAKIHTADATVAKTRTTSVTESGNNAASQAAIGETINYTVTTTIPAGTTVYSAPKIVDDLGARQQYVAGTASATLNGAPLPAGWSVSESGNVITVQLPSTYANATDSGDDVVVLTFSAKVLDVTANTRGTNIPNSAKLTYADQNGTSQTKTSPTVNTTIVEPKISLAKSHTPTGAIAPGQIVDFTVKASNASGTNVSTAHEVVVVDTVPVGTDPVDTSGNPIADGGTVPASGGIWNATARTITWTKTTTPALATLAPGASTDLTYRVKLETSPVGGNTYTNKVDATTTSLDASVGGVRTSTSTASTAGDYKAHAEDTLSVILPTIAKEVDPTTATIGQKLTWTVKVTVPKDTRFYDATVVDTLPDGVDFDSYVSATCTAGCLGSDPAIATFPVTSGTGGTLQAAWFLGDLAPSASNRTYELVLTGHVRDTYRSGGAKVLDTQSLVNRASIKTDRTDKVGPSPTTVPGTFDDTVGPVTATTVVKEPKLTLKKVADKGPFVEGGDTVTYTITVKNEGTWPAYDVVVDDQPDSALQNVVLGTGASYNTDGWTAGDPHMRWVVPGPVAVGATVTFTYTAQVKPATQLTSGQQIVNTAKVVSDYGLPKSTRDQNPGWTYREYTGPQDTVTLTVAVPNLTIDKTPDNGDAVAGTASSFTIKVKNTDAHATAHNVTVHDVYDAGLSYTAGTATASPATGFSETGADATARTIDWKVATLAPGATVTITVPVQVAASAATAARPTVLKNVATTRADDAPTEKSDDGSLKVTAKTDIQVTKTSDHDPVVPGTNLTYTLVVKNNGPSDAKATKLVDTLPSYLTYVSDDSAACDATGQVFSCDFGILPAGESRTVHLTVKLDPARTTSILNAADVTTTTPETTTTNNHSEAPNTVKPTADVSIHKTADHAVYQGGDTVTYTLTAHNNGPSTATGVVIDDDLPTDKVDFVSAGPNCTYSSGHVHCTVGTLAPGADATVTIVTKAKGTKPAPPAPGVNTHKITVDKAEQYVSIAAGETKTIDLTCPANGYAVDGNLQVVHVDSPGTPADVEIKQASSVAPGTYRFVVTNHAAGQAQVRPHIVCLPHDTDADTNTHPLDVGPLQSQTTAPLSPGTHEFVLPVSGGHHAVAQGIEVLSGKARLIGSEPVTGGWKYIVDVDEAAVVTLSQRELSDYTAPAGDPAHVHAFSFQHVVQTFTVHPGENTQLRVSCPVGYKGIVATYDVPDGVIPTGSVPEPINRDFDLYSTLDHDVQVTLDLECISIETGPPLVIETVVNTATVGSATFDPDTTNNSSSVTVQVERAPGPIDDGGTTGGTTDPAPADPTPAPADPAPADPAPAAPAPSPTPGPNSVAPRFGKVSVAATGSTASVPVTCASGTCSGTVTVTAVVPAAQTRGAVAAKAKTKKIVLGKASYKVKAGRTATVTVKIASRYRALVKSGAVKSVTLTTGKTSATAKVTVAKAKKKSSKKG